MGCLRSGGLQRGLWSLFWPWPCLGLCAVALPARTQGWGRGTVGGEALGAGLKQADLCVLGRQGSQLNGWRMGRRAPGGDVIREGFFHTVAKVIIVLRRRADPGVGLGGWRLATRPNWWVGGELSPGLGSGVDSARPGPPARSERALGERALGAPLSCRESPGREPPAQVLWGSGCAQPGEKRKTTGGEGGSGREGGSEGRGGRPAPVLARTLMDPERGARWGPPGPLGQGRAHSSDDSGRSSAPQPSPNTLPHGPGPGKGSSNPWRRLRAFSLVPVAPPATRGRVGGPAQHPLPAPINPYCPVSGLGPALSPSLQASAPSPGC